MATDSAEFAKLTFALVASLAFKQSLALPPSQSDGSSSTFARVKPYLRFAVPACLYFINNTLFFAGLQVTTPALLQLPLTAVLHHLVVRPRRNPAMWTSLAILTVGLVLAGAPEALWDALWDSRARSAIHVNDMLSGPTIGLTIGVISACASVWTELMLKDEVEFWTAQVHLYGWGTGFAGAFALVRGLPSLTASAFAAYLVLVPVTAASGLLVAGILRQRDNLVKLVGASLCITTVYLTQHVFFPSVSTVEGRSVLGIGILTVATWTYNHYKDVGTEGEERRGPIYLELATMEDDDSAGANDTDRSQDKPALSASAPSPPSEPSSPSPYRPTPSRLALAVLATVVAATLASLAPASERSFKRDLDRFFKPRGIKPATWGETVTDPYCLFDKIRSLTVNEVPDFMGDFADRQPDLGCPMYPVPDTGYLFHAFWSGPWQISHSVTTDAFLATQRLSDGHRLIWWYQGDGPDEAFLERYISPSSPYAPYVEVRRFVDDVEAAGTCLTSMREWLDPEYGKSLEMPIQTRSDLVRLLLLSKYGGVWLDADTYLIRDMTPLLRLGPWVPYQPSDGAINNHLLSYGPAWAEHGKGILEMACSMPYNQTLFEERFPSFKLIAQHYWLYNSAVHRLCHDHGCGIYGGPLEWLDVLSNGWTHINIWGCEVDKETGVGNFTVGRPLPPQLHGPFAYHGRMAKVPAHDRCWQPENGTTISALVRRIKEVLDHLPLEDAHDLFPGPGYVGHGLHIPGPPLRPNWRFWGDPVWPTPEEEEALKSGQPHSALVRRH
ncbi:hypothetical protein JCM10207_007015 [Rhodosporidiobolus poonsookiae]